MPAQRAVTNRCRAWGMSRCVNTVAMSLRTLDALRESAEMPILYALGRLAARWPDSQARYLSQARDHADLERRLLAYDAHRRRLAMNWLALHARFTR